MQILNYEIMKKEYKNKNKQKTFRLENNNNIYKELV